MSDIKKEHKKILFLDIETLPADEADSRIMANLKHLYEKKPERNRVGEEKISFADFYLNTSFDGSFGRIVCIALAVGDGEVKSYDSGTPENWNEKKLLQNFWQVAGQCDSFVGHNIIEFDMRFIWQRSIILGIKPSWQDSDMKVSKYLSFAKYRSFPMFDTMQEWSKWGFRDNLGLEHMALALDIPTPKEGIDGSQVYNFYKRGELKQICDYCKRDVETTRAVYEKMNFSQIGK